MKFFRRKIVRKNIRTVYFLTIFVKAFCGKYLSTEINDTMRTIKVLNLADIDRDAEANAARIDRAREMEEEARKALEINIEEYRLKIDALKNEMAEGWVAGVRAVYDKAIAAARNRIAPEKFAKLLQDYADFLRINKQYHLVGTLYDECLAIHRRLAEKNPEAFDSDVADTLNSLGLLHNDLHNYLQAETELTESLKIRFRLAKKNPEAFDDVATTLNNLGVLHMDLKNYSQAEKEYTESLKIRFRLAKKNPEAFDDVATTLNNLGVLHMDLKNYSQAEKEYTESLEIRRRLAAKNPEAFEPDVATTLNNLGTLHVALENYSQAETDYTESLKIRRRLAAKNPEAFEPDVARTLINLSVLHHSLQNYSRAGKDCTKSLEIYRRLDAKNPGLYREIIQQTERAKFVMEILSGEIQTKQSDE